MRSINTFNAGPISMKVVKIGLQNKKEKIEGGLRAITSVQILLFTNGAHGSKERSLLKAIHTVRRLRSGY